jgi:hypothetical protein
MDVHVPRAITTALRLRKIDVLTAQEDGMAELDDEHLLRRATELGRILVSQDQDLLREGARRQSRGPGSYHYNWEGPASLGEKYIEHSIGSARNPMTNAQLEAKFAGLADGVVPPDQTRRLMARAAAV